MSAFGRVPADATAAVRRTPEPGRDRRPVGDLIWTGQDHR
jgi:hypothetical protein